MTPEMKAWLDEYQFPMDTTLTYALWQFQQEFGLDTHEVKRVLMEWMEEL